MSASKNNVIVFLRHGESEWNRKNLFCGWVDTDLSKRGVTEAEQAAETLKEAGFKFDEAHTSVLKRAQKTLSIVLRALDQTKIPVHTTWRLNERHYGGLTGMNKQDAVKVYGEDQVKLWRRSYNVAPPKITEVNPFYERIVNDPIYANGPSAEEFPLFESLKTTIDRTLPYWNDEIVPRLKDGRRILVVAHGNSLRGLVKVLDNISDEEIAELNIPTGMPFFYELNKDLEPVISMKFLADDDTVRKAMEKVAAQGAAPKPIVTKVIDVEPKVVDAVENITSQDQEAETTERPTIMKKLMRLKRSKGSESAKNLEAESTDVALTDTSNLPAIPLRDKDSAAIETPIADKVEAKKSGAVKLTSSIDTAIDKPVTNEKEGAQKINLKEDIEKKVEKIERAAREELRKRAEKVELAAKEEIKTRAGQLAEKTIDKTAEKLSEKIAEKIIPKDEFKIPKDELKTPKDELKTPKDELKTAKEELKIAKHELKIAKDELKTEKDEPKTAKGELKIPKEESRKKIEDEDLTFDDDKSGTTEESSDLSKSYDESETSPKPPAKEQSILEKIDDSRKAVTLTEYLATANQKPTPAEKIELYLSERKKREHLFGPSDENAKFTAAKERKMDTADPLSHPVPRHIPTGAISNKDEPLQKAISNKDEPLQKEDTTKPVPLRIFDDPARSRSKKVDPIKFKIPSPSLTDDVSTRTLMGSNETERTDRTDNTMILDKTPMSATASAALLKSTKEANEDEDDPQETMKEVDDPLLQKRIKSATVVDKKKKSIHDTKDIDEA